MPTFPAKWPAPNEPVDVAEPLMFPDASIVPVTSNVDTGLLPIPTFP